MNSVSIEAYKAMLKANKRTSKKRRLKALKGEKARSEGEVTLAAHLQAYGIMFKQEFKFHSERRWKADFHILDTKILVEVEGAIWSNGRHTRAKGYLGDMEKYNAAAALGYQVYRFSTEQVKSGMAIQQIRNLTGE